MAEPRADGAHRSKQDLEDWGYEGARGFALELALRMTPAERLRWLEETVAEMRSLCGLAAPERAR